MKSENITRLSIDVPHDLHQVMKFHIAANRLNIKNYVLGLIKEDLGEDLEDYLLGQMAQESAKKGSLGTKESQKFFKKLKKSLTTKPAKKTIKTPKHQSTPQKNAKIKSVQKS